MRILAFIVIFAISIVHVAFALQAFCDYKVEVLVNGTEFQKEDFTWKMKATKIDGKSTNITGTARIEDTNGKTVKNYKPWTSESISKQKTSSEYSPNLKSGAYRIIAEIKVECNDTNNENNIDTKAIRISGEKQEIAIEKNYSNITYQETKNIINITDDIKEIMPDTPQNNSVDNGELEFEPSQESKLKNSTEREEIENVIHLTTKNNQKNNEPKITANAVQSPKVIYESSNEKAKSLIVIFILVLSVLLNIVLIWKR